MIALEREELTEADCDPADIKLDTLIEINREQMKRTEERKILAEKERKKVEMSLLAEMAQITNTSESKADKQKSNYFIEKGLRVPIHNVNVEKIPEVIEKPIKVDLSVPLIVKRETEF